MERDALEVQVDEGGDDLEAALRREGYRLSRHDLDRLIEEHEYEKFKGMVRRYAREAGVEPALPHDEHDNGNDEDDDGKGRKRKSPLPRAKRKLPEPAPSAVSNEDDEHAWV